jgi:peptidoglycan/xylan/chitin deacetylase (PgdA/CDA1 family)
MKARLGRPQKSKLNSIQAAMLAAILFLSAVAVPHPVRAEEPAASTHPSPVATKSSQSNLYNSLSSGKRMNPQTSSVVQASAAGPTVYLTFDDGPSNLTAQVLDILHKEGITASFFVLGNQAESRGKVIKRAVTEGHTVGNHTYNHVYKELYGSFDQFWKQVERTDGIIRKITGQENMLLRAPGGTYSNFDAFYYYLLDSAGYRLFDWNVDSGDAVHKSVPAAEIVANVKASTLRDKMVVLMHDGIGHEETVKALPQIIAYYKAKGYAFKSLQPDTPKVQFPLTASRWKRSMAYSDFTRLLAEAELKQLAIRDDQLAVNSQTGKKTQANQTTTTNESPNQGQDQGEAQEKGLVKDHSQGPEKGQTEGRVKAQRQGQAKGHGLGQVTDQGRAKSTVGHPQDTVQQTAAQAITVKQLAASKDEETTPSSLAQQAKSYLTEKADLQQEAQQADHQQVAQKVNQQQLAAKQAAPPKTTGVSREAARSKTLEVIINGTSWMLQEHQYSLADGRFVVPAAELARRLQGVVIGSEAAGQLETAIGWASVGIDTRSHTVRIQEPGGAGALHPLIGMQQEADGIAITLRPFIELLGGRVAGYTVSSGGGVVEIEYQPKPLLFSTTLLTVNV